jgi:hypothetical protein
MRGPRVYWDIELGWTVDTPVALNSKQLEAVVAWTKKVQTSRLIDKSGDTRDQMLKALQSLSPQTLKQNLLPESGFANSERVLFKR